MSTPARWVARLEALETAKQADEDLRAALAAEQRSDRRAVLALAVTILLAIAGAIASGAAAYGSLRAQVEAQGQDLRDIREDVRALRGRL